MIITKISLICLFLTVCFAGRIPIQSHSFNDLDYIQNLINKGVDHYKIDVSMANRKSCQQFSTWNRAKKCLKSDQYVEQICCLALRGDASSRPSFTFPFNTSQQYSKFMDSVLTQIVASEPQRKILFAINFQYKHSFQDFITEQFLLELANIMSKFPKNVLLGTGSDNFILQYDRICNGKVLPECNQMRKKISKSNMFLQSGGMNPYDPRDYYKRYRNFNVIYKQIEKFCRNGFPTWINNYPQFPLIFWQPSNQKQLQRVLSQFLSPTCMQKHGRNLSGLAVASNIDPEMFNIYMKFLKQPTVSIAGNLQQVRKVSWKVDSEKLFANQQKSLKIAKFTVGKDDFVFSSSINILTNKLLLQKWEYDSKSGQITESFYKQLTILKQTEKIQYLLHDGVESLIMITSKSASNSTTVYYFNAMTLDLVSSKAWNDIYGAYMKGNELTFITCQFSNCYIKGSKQLKEPTTYAKFYPYQLIKTITSFTQFNKDYIVVGQSKATPGLSSALIIRNGNIIPPEIPLTLGTNAKIFKKENGKEVGILLENGMCHSALLINNGNMNKCNFYKQPELNSLRNVRGLVVLMEANVQQLMKNRQIVSPCHPKIMMTKIMNGVNPDIVELPSLKSYLISSQYLRIQDQDLTASLFCGGSNFDKQFKYREKSSILTTMYLSNQKVNILNKGNQILEQ